MKKLNKKIVCALGAALMVAAVGATSVSAATGTTNVDFDPSNLIPGGPTPGTSEWGVSIPSDTTFVAVGEIKPMDVELHGMNGTATADITQTITVTVASANTFNLQNGASALPYTLAYGANSNAALATPGFTLTAANTTQAGTATLVGPVVSTTPAASHTDVLTYTVTGA